MEVDMYMYLECGRLDGFDVKFGCMSIVNSSGGSVEQKFVQLLCAMSSISATPDGYQGFEYP